WVANGVPTDPEKMLSWRPGALTCFYDYLRPNRVFEYKARYPEALIVVRFAHPRHWQEDPATTAQNLGYYVAAQWPSLRDLDPYVYFGNEMNLHYESGDPDGSRQPRYETREFYEKYAAWVRTVAEVIKNRVPEMKLVTPPFAYGHGEDGAPDDSGQPSAGWAGYDFLADTIRQYFDNIITFHSYWGHGGGSVKDWLYDPVLSTWYAHRWQRVLKLFKTRYGIDARVIIDEAGNFAAGDPDFSQQIIDHAMTCLTDPRVLAVTYFLWEDPTFSPGNLPNAWTHNVQRLDEHVTRLAALPDFPVGGDDTAPGSRAPTTIRVLFSDGSVRAMPLEEYLRAVVPAEMPALWPAEALKAQAVAARTYAQFSIEHPRHPEAGADICTDPAHCQNYDPGRIHPASDNAILATDGIVMQHNRQTIDAVFSANCGGHTFNNEDVFNGPPAPYLRGVPCPAPGPRRGHGVGLCQVGARAFAGQDFSYDRILGHYYRGVGLVPPEVLQAVTIRGFVLDLLDAPLPDVRVVLNSAGGQAETRTAADGGYRFADLPPDVYRLSLPDFDLERPGIEPEAGGEAVVNFTVDRQPPPQFAMRIRRYVGGLPLLAGNLAGQPDVPVTVTDPAGVTTQVRSGDKPEHGQGGFEVYAPLTGDYLVQFLGQRFAIPMEGQFTQVTFERGGTAIPMQSAIHGVLTNQAGQPLAGRDLSLGGEGQVLLATTNAAGAYRFENLAPGQYTLLVSGSSLEERIVVDGISSQAVDLRLPPPAFEPEAVSGGWGMRLERGEGLPLLVGDIGEAGQAIVITDPAGFQTQVVSGSKAEFGAGGFEVYAPVRGAYTVQFLEAAFTVPMNGRFTRLTFRRHTPPPDERVRLISQPLPSSQAQSILAELEADSDTTGMFVIEET
ncbi:MAG: SpoIID/LytB domain-containing protein, partial [Anaerolineae bacterium]